MVGDQTRRVRRTQIQTTRSRKRGVGRDAWGASVLEWSLQAEWRVVGWATPQAWHPVERLECGQEISGQWLWDHQETSPKAQHRLPGVVVTSSS